MGFFIGWKYFEDKDYYSFDAQAERNRLRQEKVDQERKAQKKAERRREREKEKKRQLQDEWVSQAAEYHKDQFGLDGYSYESSYINANVEEYKTDTEKKYSSSFHSTDEKQAPSLNRGMGSGPTMKVSGNPSGKRGDDLHKIGALRNRRPHGMAPIGMEKNDSVAGSPNDAKDSAGPPPMAIKLNRPF